jgi:hypothetical protein
MWAVSPRKYDALTLGGSYLSEATHLAAVLPPIAVKYFATHPATRLVCGQGLSPKKECKRRGFHLCDGFRQSTLVPGRTVAAHGELLMKTLRHALRPPSARSGGRFARKSTTTSTRVPTPSRYARATARSTPASSCERLTPIVFERAIATSEAATKSWLFAVGGERPV